MWYPFQIFLFVYVCWLLYLAVMNLKRAKDADTLSKPALILGYPALFLGLLLDTILNWAVFSILTLDLPREYLTTTHLNRLLIGPPSWRRSIALWICRNLLDTFDPSGPHCKGE